MNKELITLKAIEALRNKGNEIIICDQNIPPKSLQNNEIEIYKKEISNEQNFIDYFTARIKDVFSNYESLNISFLNTDCIHQNRSNN